MRTPEPLLPCEELLFHSELVKIGRFDCAPDDDWFRETAPMHNHLLVFTRKPLWWRRSEGIFRYAEPGAALFHRAGGEVQRRSATGDGDFSDWFGIREDLFREALDRNGLDYRDVTGRATSTLTSLPLRFRQRRLLGRLERGACPSSAVEEECLGLLDAVCHELAGRPEQAPARGQTRIRRRQLADRARQFINDAPDFSLPVIAGHLGVSVFHMCRVFRQETGMTLNRYYQQQRIGAALGMMIRKPQDLTTLAHQLGFSSHSHFTRVFKSELGVPPSLINGG